MTRPTISGYTTSFNCIEMEYPLELCIRSLLPFCDEVVVVDAGSTDGTLELLGRLSKENSKIKVFVEPVNFNHPRWAIHQDGYLKRKAREKCTGDYCWQTDSDEIVAPTSYDKIQLLPNFLEQTNSKIMMLPMVEFWGSFDSIRADFLTWKQRFSKNTKEIVHGIPLAHRLLDEMGHEYPRPFFSDSCNYIDKDTGIDIPTIVPLERSFKEVNGLSYEERRQIFFASLDNLPHVLHLSWLSLERKIKHYRKHWQKFHASMYNLSLEDNAQTNVMFNKPWSEVTDFDIAQKATELKAIGPRSFHHKINPAVKGEVYPYSRPIPQELINWNSSCGKPYRPVVKVNAKPLITAVIPSYNKAPYLKEAVESVLNQDFKEIEVLIVNDGSTDNTSVVAKDLISSYGHRDIKLLEKKNGGISEARNYGIERAAGDLILTLDGDDKIKPSFIAKALKGMSETKANLACCNVEVFGEETGEWIPQAYEEYNLRYQNSIPTLVLYEKWLWQKTGGYKVALPIVEDWEFFISCSRYGLNVFKVEEKLFQYRSSSTGLANTFKDSHVEVQSLIMSANHDLFPIEEVLFAHDHLKAHMPERFHSRFETQDKLHPTEWLLKFWLALKEEGTGDLQKALNLYIEAMKLSNLKQWQPIYRAGRILHLVGQAEQAQDFLWSTKALRPDMKRIVKELQSQTVAGLAQGK